MIKPVRTKGESNALWISRRNNYRLELIESQIEQLQKAVKGFKK